MIRAGAASVAITPPVGAPMAAFGLRKGVSLGVHDDLKARALVLEDGGEQVALITLDTVFTDANITKRARERIRQLTGIKGKNVMVAATHTHTSPYLPTAIGMWGDRTAESGYVGTLPEYIAGSVLAAQNLLQPATIGVATSSVPGISVNRRHPENPIDTELKVLKVGKKVGGTLALFLHFACHPLIVGGQSRLWTADFPGFVCDFVENVLPGSVCMFANGAAGDINPWDYYFGNEQVRHQPTFQEAESFARILASEAVKVAESAKTKPSAELGARTRTVKLPKKKIPSVDEAEKLYNDILATEKPWNKPTWDPEDNISIIFRRHPGEYLISTARHLLSVAREGQGPISAEFQAIRIGGVGLTTIPGELFNELGLEIKRKSPFKDTLVVTYANDSVGYIPTAQALDECAGKSLKEGFGLTYCYGVTLPSSRLAQDGVRKVVSSAVDALHSVE